MSWHVSAVGKAPAVATKLAADIARMKCAEPEEAIKNSIAEVIAKALSAFPPDCAVRVEARGSQSPAPNDKFTNQLKVSIEPLWGFVE
jgi:hypothetical protein